MYVFFILSLRKVKFRVFILRPPLVLFMPGRPPAQTPSLCCCCLMKTNKQTCCVSSTHATKTTRTVMKVVCQAQRPPPYTCSPSKSCVRPVDSLRLVTDSTECLELTQLVHSNSVTSRWLIVPLEFSHLTFKGGSETWNFNVGTGLKYFTA